MSLYKLRNVFLVKCIFILQGGFLLARLVKYVTQNFVTEEDAEEIETFFRDHHTPGTERSVQQSCETVRLNAAWLKRDRDSVHKYLSFGK
jgi:puromycin-sensitive aminopeptidase